MSALDGFLNAVSFFLMMAFVEFSTQFIDGVLHGFNFPKWWPFKKKSTKPILKAFKIPPIVIKIIMGLVYQKLFPFLYETYNKKWTAKTRTLILSTILLRAGLELDFKGKGLQSLACGFIPVMSEVLMSSVIGHFGMGLPYSFAITQGYVLGAGSPGIIIPILLNFKMRGMGVDNGVTSMMIAAITIDEISSIIGLGAAQTFAFNEVIEHPQTTDEIVLHLIYQILAAIGVGTVAALFMFPLRNCSNKVKVVPLISFAIGIIFAFEAANFYESKYLASLIFGYVTNKIWHENAPEHELNQYWKILSPALFGSIGADLDLGKINAGVLGWTFLLIFCGLTTKFMAMWALANIFFKKTWSKGERLFSAGCCLGKAAFQASLGSSVLNMAIAQNATAFIPVGYDVLTISVLAILVAGPAGSITSIALGNKHLSKKVEKTQKHVIPEEQPLFAIDDKDNPALTGERNNILITNDPIQIEAKDLTLNKIPENDGYLSSDSSSSKSSGGNVERMETLNRGKFENNQIVQNREFLIQEKNAVLNGETKRNEQNQTNNGLNGIVNPQNQNSGIILQFPKDSNEEENDKTNRKKKKKKK